MIRPKFKGREPAPVFIGILFLLLFPALFRPFIHGADSVGYYSWVRSVVIEGTLDVKNAFHHYSNEFGGPDREIAIHRKTPNGYTHNQWSAGSAVLWAPSFVAAHAAVLFARAMGSDIRADGYSWPYPLAASLSSAIYGLIALLLTYAMAKRLTDPFSAGLSVITVWLASPMVFYMYAHPLLSHANDAFIHALFIYVWWRTQQSLSVKAGLARGALAGLATWIRPQNAILIIILGVETFIDLVQALRNRPALKPFLQRSVATLGGYLLFFIPLMIFWQVVFGLFFANTYAPSQGTGIFDWSAPHILKVLFSSNRGLFIWAPVTVPALIGLRWLFKQNTRLTLLLGALFFSQLYIIGSWFGWSGNVAFGPRFWVAQTTLFALGLAALIHALPGKRILWTAIGGVFIAWNLLLIVQYVLQTIPRYGSVDLGEMVRNQFLVIPENLSRILRTLLTRGR